MYRNDKNVENLNESEEPSTHSLLSRIFAQYHDISEEDEDYLNGLNYEELVSEIKSRGWNDLLEESKIEEVKKTLDDVYSDSATEALWDKKFNELVPEEGKADSTIGEIMRCFAAMSHAYLQNGEIINNMQQYYLTKVWDLEEALKQLGDSTLSDLLDKMYGTRNDAAYDHYMAAFYEYFVNNYLKDNKEVKEESINNINDVLRYPNIFIDEIVKRIITNLNNNQELKNRILDVRGNFTDFYYDNILEVLCNDYNIDYFKQLPGNIRTIIDDKVKDIILPDTKIEESEKNPQEFEYRMLARLKSDCDYYLGNGNRNAEHSLWAKNEQGQIDKMREIYNQLKEKPEWLSEEDINNYAKEMGVIDLPSTTDGTAEKEIQDMLDRSEKRSKEDLTESNENKFSGTEFEKKIPHVMRFKEYDVKENEDGKTLYWVTQQFFTLDELEEFQKAFVELTSDNFKDAYVTVRDLSHYNLDEDYEDGVLCYITAQNIDCTGYEDACEKYKFDLHKGWLDESKKITEAEDMEAVKDEVEAAVEDSSATDLEKDQVAGSIEVLKTDEESAIEGYEDFNEETAKVVDKELADAVENQMEEIIDDEKEHIEKLDTIQSALEENKELKKEDKTIWSSRYEGDEETANQAYQEYLDEFESTPKTPKSFEDWLEDTKDIWFDAEANNYREEHPEKDPDKLSDWEIDEIDFEIRERVEKEIEANMDDLKEQYEEYCEEIKKEMTSPLDKEKWLTGWFEQDAQAQWEVMDEDFSFNVWPMIQNQCKDDILILFGSIGRWNGTFDGGKIIHADEENIRNIMGDYDEISVYADNEGHISMGFDHHDGTDSMALYTIPEDLTELAKAMEYEDVDELDMDIRQDNVDMEELAKNVNKLIPIINK